LYKKKGKKIMKKIFIFLFAIALFAPKAVLPQDKPEKVYSIVKQVMPFEWYQKQAELWKIVIDKQPNSPEAWLYYYTANRMARFVGYDKWERTKTNYFTDLDTIVSKMKKAIPNTYEYYYIQGYNNGNWDDEDVKMAEKAYELDPSRPEVYDDLIGFYEVFGNKAKFRELCGKMYESNDISSGIYNWNYNVLMSLEKNAIILTNGDNDTYPPWVLQQVKNIKPDVIILNISLLSLDSYRDKKFAELKFKPFKLDTAKIKASENYGLSIGEQIIKHIVENAVNSPVYFSMTLNPDYYKNFKDDIYMIGLAFKYSKEKFDNMALLRKNYENNFLLDYLKDSFSNDISQAVVNQINMNYIPAFLKLYEHYNLAGENEKAGNIEFLIRKIASDSGREKEVDSWFGNPSK
jgi:hypothetical protein